MLIDTHLHVIDKSVLNYPWLADVEALDRDFSYESYEREARQGGIEATLHMEVDVEPSQIERETENVARLAARDNSLIVGAISSARPEEDGFAAFLERQIDNPLVKGFRRVLHVVPDEVSQKPLFRENLKRLSDTRFTFDLCVLPHQIPLAIELVDLAPDVRFVLDHCGVPDIRNDAFTPWKDHVDELARRDNVTAKISGVVAYAEPGSWTVDTLRPYVDHTVEKFGFDRLVWGSDWPVCTLGGGLHAWLAATQALFSGCTAQERAKLFRENAKRLWKLRSASDAA
ncbi:amidohydrolase family protein [Nitratireductor basaltis]|uniref:Amidohydrolase 2 n=1 Tax=Nitratireductor basaltis TaxID=472175 RepID=A0A084U5D1_9HYPH|nr:amidohydrolase [Nitratireductor basaltis]KFB08167.1 Amidohydrolase 2 [Nitratireductor basaltis]